MSKPTDEAISEWDSIWKKRFAAYRCQDCGVKFTTEDKGDEEITCPLCPGKAIAVREAKG